MHFLRGAVISNELPDAFGVERCLVGLCAQGGGADAGATATNGASGGRASAQGLRGDRTKEAGLAAATDTTAASTAPAAASRPPPLRAPSLDPAAWSAQASAAVDDSRAGVGSGVGSGVGFGGAGLTLQRGVVIPLIRAKDLSDLLLCSGEPLTPDLSPHRICAASRAARAFLLAGLRDGSWELGSGGGEQSVVHAADALREWLHVPPPPTPPPPLVLQSTMSPRSPPTWSTFWSADAPPSALPAASPPSWGGRGRRGSGDSAGSSVPRSAPHPSEWIYLPREAYCALKGRCCNSSASPPLSPLSPLSPTSPPLLSGQAPSVPEDDTSQWGSPLEVALDRAVVIGEALETIRQPMTSAGGSAGGHETGPPAVSHASEPTSEGASEGGPRGMVPLSPRAQALSSSVAASAAPPETRNASAGGAPRRC